MIKKGNTTPVLRSLLKIKIGADGSCICNVRLSSAASAAIARLAIILHLLCANANFNSMGNKEMGGSHWHGLIEFDEKYLL